MNGKILAIVAYLGIIGWVISYVIYGNNEQKTSLEKFHLKQGFGVAVLSLLPWLLGFILPYSLLFLSSIVWLLVLVLAVLGIINAANEKETELPAVGNFLTTNVNFIK